MSHPSKSIQPYVHEQSKGNWVSKWILNSAISSSSRAQELYVHKNVLVIFPKCKGERQMEISACKTVDVKGRVNIFPCIQPWATPKSLSRHEMGRHFTWCCSDPTSKLPFRGISRQTSRPSTGRSKRRAITVARPFHVDRQHPCRHLLLLRGCCDVERITY